MPTRLSLSCFLLIFLSASWFSSPFVASQSWPIDAARSTNAATYSFLPQVLEGVDVVTLGESIHMTHEFPLVRLGMVRELNEQMGFHTVAFEGSPLDLWATQDRFLASARGAEDAKAAMGGLLRIWNDPEYAEIFEYEAASWSTPTPLYMTAWDIQPGIGGGTEGAEAFRLFAEQLRHYALPPAGMDEAAWLRNIYRTRCQNGVSPDDPAALQAIDELRQWILLAQPVVQKTYPALPHAEVLALIPNSLRRSLALCPPPGKTYWDVVANVREAQAAPYTLELQKALPDHKLILWAHTHHAGYFPGSVASRLKEVLGDRIYSLNVFSDGGGAILLYSNTAHEDLGYARLRRAQGDLREWIDSHGHSPIFVNLRGNTDAVFRKPQSVQFEGRWGAMLLPAITDGVLWVPDVHSPHYPPVKLLIFSLWHVRWPLCVGLISVVLLILALVVWTIRRRSKRTRLARF